MTAAVKDWSILSDQDFRQRLFGWLPAFLPSPCPIPGESARVRSGTRIYGMGFPPSAGYSSKPEVVKIR